VGRSDLGRAVQSPLRIEPARGKVGEHHVESPPNMTWDVLQANEGGVALVDDPSDLGPQVPLVGDPEALPGDAERLARVRASHDIHEATPRHAVEGSQVVVDRSRIQGRRRHPGHEDSRSEGIPLDHAHNPQPGEGGAEPEVEPPDAGAEGEGVQGTCSHVMPPARAAPASDTARRGPSPRDRTGRCRTTRTRNCRACSADTRPSSRAPRASPRAPRRGPPRGEPR
jgi:hypothetical protein